ncbi:MAG TPA: LysR family transcriptional regulator [Polyangiaceae bacterium]|jgi:DNA-binding transcriptional LysR family regulator|nr:LysR family transcriptional regulator [Polyangiaceae bacterium]
MNGIDLNDVSTFVHVADGGGFTAAAKALGVPKSTVSRALVRLERKLGVRLVQRTSRLVALTDAGKAYYERVRGAVASVSDATADVVDMGTEPRGTIRLTAPADLGQALVAGVVASFARQYPQVVFEVTLTSRVVDLVAEGYDLAVRASPLRDSSLVARKLGEASLGLFAAPEYLDRRGTPARVADLSGHDFVTFRSMGHGSMLPLTGPAGDEVVEVHGTITSDDLLFIQRLLTAGAGIGLVPLFFSECASREELSGLRRVLPQWTVRGAGVSIVAPSARQEPRRVKLFREALLAEAKRRDFGR